MSVRIDRGKPMVLNESQLKSKVQSDRILVRNLLDQNKTMYEQLLDLETSYDLLKTKTSRSIGSLNDAVSWIKVWLGGMTVVLALYILGDVLGAW